MSEEKSEAPKLEGEQQQRAREKELEEQHKEVAGLLEMIEAGAKEAEKLKELRKKLKQRRDELKGKGIDELLAEILATEKKLEQLVREKDIEKFKPEIRERSMHFSQVHIQFQREFRKKTKEVGDYLKWAEVLEAERWSSARAEASDIEDHRRISNDRLKKFKKIEGLKKNAKDEGLSMGEYLQWQNLFILEETIFENLKSGAKERTLSMQNSIATIYFQAETAETMLKVEGRLQEVEKQQKLTTNILKKVEKNTSTWRQLGLLVLVSSLSVIGAPLFQEYGIPFLKDHPLRSILWVLVLVFAGLEIGTRVKKKN